MDHATSEKLTSDELTDPISRLFMDIESTHGHEENLRQESMAMIESDPELSWRLEIIQKAMTLIVCYTMGCTSSSDDEQTVRLLGVRLFNAAASGIKLALSGYYQTAFHQARDIIEVGYLLDYFRTSPEQRAAWRKADKKTHQQNFAPVKVRIKLDERDGDLTKKREREYNKLSELASHATFRGFQLTTRGEFAELGPFIEKTNLMAWLEEMVLRLGPTAVVYASQFPDASQELIQAFREFGTELIRRVKPEAAGQG